MSCHFRLCCSVLAIITGVCFIVLGAVLISVFAKIIHDKIVNNVVLENGTDAFESWKSPPVPVYMQFWVFDLINKDEVIDNGSKPVVREWGPFTYRELRPKHSIEFNENSTVTYDQNKTYVFVREMSVSDANFTVTTVNLLYATIAEMFAGSSGAVKILLNRAFKITGESLFDTYTVHDLIWGYRIDALKKIADLIHWFSPSTKIPYDIGLFADLNGTSGGTYTVFTGAERSERLNLIDNWEGMKYLPYWSTPLCNQINGTDGTAYHPFIDKSESLFVFSPDICRSIYVRYLEDVEILGVPLYRFTAPSRVFANHTVNPDNIGFCTPGCLDAGVLNISVCKGAPVIMSQPHLLDAALQYLDAIEGLHPDPVHHRTDIDVEPHTGLVLNAAKRLQVNVYIRSIEHISDTEKLPDLTIFPVAWLNESAALDEASANKFRSQVLTPILVTHIVQYALIALGIFLLSVVLIVYIRRAMTERNNIVQVNLGERDGNVQYERFG